MIGEMIENKDAWGRLEWFLADVASIIWMALEQDCLRACDWTPPYDWVPEAGCPIHDSVHKWHGWLFRLIKRLIGDA